MNIFSKDFPLDALVSRAYPGRSVLPAAAEPFTFHGFVADFPTSLTSCYLGFLVINDGTTVVRLTVAGIQISVGADDTGIGKLFIFDHISALGHFGVGPVQFIGYRVPLQGTNLLYPASDFLSGFMVGMVKPDYLDNGATYNDSSIVSLMSFVAAIDCSVLDCHVDFYGVSGGSNYYLGSTVDVGAGDTSPNSLYGVDLSAFPVFDFILCVAVRADGATQNIGSMFFDYGANYGYSADGISGAPATAHLDFIGYWWERWLKSGTLSGVTLVLDNLRLCNAVSAGGGNGFLTDFGALLDITDFENVDIGFTSGSHFIEADLSAGYTVCALSIDGTLTTPAGAFPLTGFWPLMGLFMP